MRRFFFILLPVLFFSGCATNAPHSAFVRTINFTPFNTYDYKHTMTSGMDWSTTDELVLEDLSEEVICRELDARGFTQVEGGSDFYVVTKWKKSATAYSSPFNSIDGPDSSFRRQNEPAYGFAARVQLTVEIYETATNQLFWRKDLPNIFDAIQFTEGRVVASLERAIEEFPNRVEKDPNLPNIE
ncbi:MAG: hypothetical protein AAGH40_14270 [Verrucomicrobiota bacterium]